MGTEASVGGRTPPHPVTMTVPANRPSAWSMNASLRAGVAHARGPAGHLGGARGTDAARPHQVELRHRVRVCQAGGPNCHRLPQAGTLVRQMRRRVGMVGERVKLWRRDHWTAFVDTGEW